MATARIFIENGKISGCVDRYFDSLSEDGRRYEGNGWVVTIRDGCNEKPGRIICHAERDYSTGPAICHREFKLEDGIVGLAGGNIYERYAYFRSDAFQEFLNKFGITAVKKQNPNKEFSGLSSWSARGEASINVFSDGDVKEGFRSRGEAHGTSTYQVTGATWAIVESRNYYGDNASSSCILYTVAKNVLSLENQLMTHPSIRKKVEDLKRLEIFDRLRGRLVHNLEEAKALLDEVLEADPRIGIIKSDAEISKILANEPKTFEIWGDGREVDLGYTKVATINKYEIAQYERSRINDSN